MIEDVPLSTCGPETRPLRVSSCWPVTLSEVPCSTRVPATVVLARTASVLAASNADCLVPEPVSRVKL